MSGTTGGRRRTGLEVFIDAGLRGKLGVALLASAVLLGLSQPAWAAEAMPVTTAALSTGPDSQLVSSVPIYKNWEPSVEKVVYSLQIPSVRAGEVLRATGGVELTGSHSYQVSASERLVIGSDPSSAEGSVVTPRANTTMTPAMSRVTLPIDGVYRPASDLGTQYLKLVVKAPAWNAQEGDTLSVASGSGELAVTRYTPTARPTSMPTDELSSCSTSSEQVTSVPVDSQWRSVLSCNMGEISTEDLFELSGQLEIGNTNASSVKLESRVLTATTSTEALAGANGLIVADEIADTLTPSNRFARVVQSNEASTNSASKHYVNLVVRAVPLSEGSLTPLTVEPGSLALNVLDFRPISGNTANALLPGTKEAMNWDDVIDRGSVPFSAERKTPTVVNSVPIDGLGVNEVFRVHGLAKADLTGKESAPVETEIVLANSKTSTTGQVIAAATGDTVPATQGLHTVSRDATFVSTAPSTNRQYLNLIVYANRAPVEPGEELPTPRSSISYSRSNPVGESTSSVPVTISALKTPPSSELVSSIPTYTTWTPAVEKVVYSLPVEDIKAGEVLSASGDFELMRTDPFRTLYVGLVLGSNPTDANGTVVTPTQGISQDGEMIHWSVPIDGVFRSSGDLGNRYLKLVVRAPAVEAKEGDSVEVVRNSGGLSVTRYRPAPSPSSLPAHQLQTCVSASEELTKIPLDSAWHAILSCDAGDVTPEDTLDLNGTIELEHLGSPVKLESRIIAATSPTVASAGPNGFMVSEDTVDTLTEDSRYTRIVQANVGATNDPAKHYVNVVLRAVPLSEGSANPLVVMPGSGRLGVLRFKPVAGDTNGEPLPGTEEGPVARDEFPIATSVPVTHGEPEPVVVNSRPPTELHKGDVLRAHGVVTAALAPLQPGVHIETELIAAESETDTSGEVIAVASGDTPPADQDEHTIVKDGTYVASGALGSYEGRYLNLIVFATNPNAASGEELNLTRATVSYSLSRETGPFGVNFEDNSLDEFFQLGQFLNITSNQAREGTKALQVDINSNSWWWLDQGQDPTHSIRRSEIVAPDYHSSVGGEAGTDRWYGWSVYFPESFKAPQIEGHHFDGAIDEVRIYNKALTAPQIVADENHEYAATPAPVAAYAFDQGAEEVEEGIARDATGNHDGSINGAKSTAGRYGSALDFNGVGNVVDVPDSTELDLENAFTLEAWVDPRSLRWWNAVLGKTEGEKGESGYLLNAGNEGGENGDPGGAVYRGGEIARVVSSSSIPLNTWSHLALTSDGSTLRIYIDGELRAQQAAISASANEADLMIGANAFNPEGAGNWDIFTQWHDTSVNNCSTKNSSIPIAFSATAYKAGWRYSSAEPPTPAAGDYIDVMFNGGQIEEVGEGWCISLKPTERHVIAPVRKGQWDDFVMHTKWTTEEGGPGRSVTSLWINGKQILGNETLPIAKPSLYWKDTRENYTKRITWQFGIYRGPTAEDPTSRLFIDSIKTGKSYEAVAPGIVAPRLDAESYPVSLAGEGGASFATSFGNFECGESSFSASMSEAARQLPLSVTYSGCSAGEGQLGASVDMNSCHYTLDVDNAGPPYAGSFRVACDVGGDAIEFKADEGGARACTAKVGPQTAHGLQLANIGEGPHRGVGVGGVAEGVEYEVEGPGCGAGPALRDDGELGAEVTLADVGGEVGVHLTGDEFLPRLEAESYGATLKGAGLPDLQTSLGTFECSGTTLQGVAPQPTNTLALTPAYGECGITVGATHYVASVKANGCHYTLGVREDVASPYAGTWGVACKEPGEAIEFKITKSAYNCLKLHPQAGHDGLAFSQAGEGTGRELGLGAEVKGVEYEWVGVCGGEARSDGVFRGETTLGAKDEDGNPIGAWLGGEP